MKLTQIRSYTGTTTFAYDELGNLREKHLPNGIKEEYNLIREEIKDEIKRYNKRRDREDTRRIL